MVGPFETSRFVVTVDGFIVPYLSAYAHNPQQTAWTLLLDNRLALDINSEHLNQFVSFLADALAIGTGYKSHSHACARQGERHNPFGTRMVQLDSIPPENQDTLRSEG